MKRSDSWSPEDDMNLANIILQSVRNGSTQSEAFKDAESKLGRTVAACGFRWNSVVRKRFEEALQKAKEYKKSNKATIDTKPSRRTAPEAAEAILENVEQDPFDLFDMLKKASGTYKRLLKDNENLRREVIRLENKLEETPNAEDLELFQKFLQTVKKFGSAKKESPAS